MQQRMTAVCVVVSVLVCGAPAHAGDQDRVLAADQPQGVEGAEGTNGSQKVGSKAASAPRRTELEEVVVEAKKPVSAASSDEVRVRDYELRPHATTMEILNNVPGLVVAQHQGGGKAPQYLIRGFDADHGTDFAVSVDGLPVNLPTHAHGQGYADLNFLIPETVERFSLRKGPYFADLGDFANAGAINFVTKDEVEENLGRAEGGSFNTQRYVAVASPKLSWAKTLIAGQVYLTDGPFVNPQDYARYNFFTKLTLTPSVDSKLSISAGVYDGTWHGSGQIPERAVSDGALALAPDTIAGQPPSRPFGRFDAIDPTEGGKSDRENLDVHYTYTPNAQDEWSFQAYGSRYKLALFTDFTFFKDTGLRFVRLSNGQICDTAFQNCGGSTDYVPGDGIEQNDSRLVYGGRAAYTRNWLLANVPLQSQIGFESRNDNIDVALYRQVERQRFFTINKVAVEERTLSGFLQQQAFLTDWIRLEAGLRGDVFFFDGRDRLPAQQPDDPNFAPTVIAGNASRSIVSPKANLIITPVENTDVYLNFGNGFHSNDARNVLANGTAALAQSTGYELGVRTRQFDRLDLASALWLLDLQSELVFDGDTGSSAAPSGPTRRWGVDFEARYQALEWLFLDYDLSWADPRFRGSGDAIPLAPTLLMNGGITTELGNGFSAALRMRYLGERPANEQRTVTAEGYFLMDLLGKYRWRNIEVSLALLNLTDTAWREAQFSDNSCLLGEIGTVDANGNRSCVANPGLQGSKTHPPDPPDAIHFTPGIPIAARGGLAVYF